MHKAVNTARKAVLYISALVLVVGYPTAAMATSEEPVTSPETAVTEQAEGQIPEPEPELTYTHDPTTLSVQVNVVVNIKVGRGVYFRGTTVCSLLLEHGFQKKRIKNYITSDITHNIFRECRYFLIVTRRDT